MTAPSMLEAALGYAALGWPVLPVHTPVDFDRCSCGEPGCGKQNGKHPRTGPDCWHGLDDATVDADTVTRWWQRWPDANIGVRTGVACDLFDIDHVDYVEATAPLEEFDFVGPIARSGSGGWHFYTAPTGLGNRTKMSGLPLDWRGARGYAILPPSLHRSGNRYEWVAAPHEHAVTPCPEVLRVFVAGGLKGDEQSAVDDVLAYLPANLPAGRGRRRPARFDRAGWNPDGLVDATRNAPEGSRNAILFWAASRVGEDERDGKCSSADALEVLGRLAGAGIAAGLSELEVRGKGGRGGTVRSGYRTGRASGGEAA